MEIRIRVIDRNIYKITVPVVEIVDLKTLENLLESLLLDNVVERIIIKIKECEECKLEALDILRGR